MISRAKLRHAARVATDWRYWPFYLQRRVMDSERRGRIARRIAGFRPALASTALATEAARTLGEEGIVHLGQLLTPEQCDALRSYFAARPVFDDYRPEVPPFLPLSDARHPDSHVAFHDPKDVLLAPGLLELANDPAVLAVVGSLLGCRPTIGYLAAWWSYSTTVGAQQAENFHRDVDDWAFIKMFVYLSDVGDDSGPHVYVRNSARDPRLTELRRFTDAEVEGAFGNNQIERITGTAGIGFLENTFGLHKGQPVRRGNRLLFQVVYSILPLPYGPRTPPLRLADRQGDEALDPWINRVYLRS